MMPNQPKTTGGYQLEGNGAELYERILVPLLLGPWADELIQLVLPAQGNTPMGITHAALMARVHRR